MWRYLLVLLPSFAFAHGGTTPEVEAELDMLTALMGEAYGIEFVGTNDAAVMGMDTESIGERVINGRRLGSARFLAMRATPRSDGGMSSWSSWVFDCDARSLAIVDIESFLALNGTGQSFPRQSWDSTEVLAGLRKPGADKLGRKMVDAACAKMGR